MSFDFQWDDETQTVLRYRTGAEWNWNELHKQMRRSTLWLDRVDHPVERVLDLTAGSSLPAGAVGHVRSLARAIHANTPARLIILGIGADLQRQIGAVDGLYQGREGMIVFAVDDDHARRILEGWRESSAS